MTNNNSISTDMILMCLSAIRSKVRTNLTGLLQGEFIHNFRFSNNTGHREYDMSIS